VAVCLAHDDVIEVVKKTTREAIEDDEKWDEQVAKPALSLATTTMTNLSDGFGRGTAKVFIWFFLVAVYNLSTLVHGLHTGKDIWNNSAQFSGEYDSSRAATHIFGIFMSIVAPLFLARDLVRIFIEVTGELSYYFHF
jgi:hypothetical protein